MSDRASSHTETDLRPLQHLRALRQRHPSVFDWVREGLARRGTTPDRTWPAWCYFPAQGASEIAHHLGARPEEALEIAALSTWRSTQGVYRIHHEILASLLETPLSGILPVDLLQRMPEWCVYLDLGHYMLDDCAAIHGYWAFLNYDPFDHRQELCFLIDFAEGKLRGTWIELIEGGSSG